MKITQPASFSSNIKTEILAICVSASDPTGLPPELDEAFGGQLADALKHEEFKGAAGSILPLRSLGHTPARWILLVGVGDWSVAHHRLAGGATGHFARSRGATDVAFATPAGGTQEEGDNELLQAVVEGVLEGNYRWNKYQPSGKAGIKHLKILGFPRNRRAIQSGLHHGAGQSYARDMVNESAEALYPETMAQAARLLRSERVKVRVWDEKRIQRAGMGGIWAVGKGSDRPPRLIHVTYTPKRKARAHIALVGKGVTFDSGGLSLKTSSGMMTMRCDMGGGAAVLGVMSALEALAPAVKVEGIVGAAENMLGGSAYKLGDVLTMHNGKTVEVHNTDAEGRLVLADCLSYASSLGVSHCVDLATLTGASVVALGNHYSALFTKSDALSDALLGASQNAGEHFWRLPLEDLYRKQLKAEWAHIKNVGGREAGAITAALFLSEFVDGPEWAHVDIAGPAFLDSEKQHFVKGATGHPVRALLRWIESF